jgi:polyhydroxybutyrate depolymerase
VIIINGTEDPMVPYGGGEIGIKKIRLGRVMSTPATAEFWAKHNGCSFPPDVTRMPDKDPADGTTLEKYEYTGGKDGSEVVLYKIIGGGHTWPGGKQYLPEKIIGRTSREIDGCRTIWEFFKKHSR